MARMPGAQWYPKNISGRSLRRKGRGIAYHVAVAEAQNLRPGPDADWHFYVARDGTIYQYIDTDYQAWTTGNGNGTMIGVETQGGLHDTEGEKWSDAALTSLARIAAWAHEVEGIPLRLMQSSRPEERGLGWHKLGVQPWVVPGGEVWSSSRGKTCPGAAKIAQMPEVLRRAQQLAGGSVANKPTPAPVEDEVTDADIQKIVAELRKADFSPADGTQSLQNLVSQIHSALNGPVSTEYTGYDKPVSRAKMIEYVDRRTGRIEGKLDELLTLLRGQQPPAA